ncbi:MAG: RNA methyltransferase, partial [Pseudomonadota bacterium]
LENKARTKTRLLATPNALDRLKPALPDQPGFNVETVDTAALQRLVGKEAVHQGAVLECAPLEPLDASELFQLVDHTLLLVLDQITDPHNVGAIMRSAVALNVGTLITTARHAAPETAVLAKSASGAADWLPTMPVRTLAKTVSALNEIGFTTLGLDSDGPADLVDTLDDLSTPKKRPLKIALVLGAEGKGLRQQTREACSHLVRLDMPGPIRSLNVSNAAALALYLARRALDQG